MTDTKYEKMSKWEKSYWQENILLVAGIDEAGRGPLAGPVVAAACILKPHIYLPNLNDSKKLSETQRLELFHMITNHPEIIFGIGIASAGEIDQINILQATFLSMKRAVHHLKIQPEVLLIDGNKAPKLPFPMKTIVKGDSLSISIAAASIIAKVTRDEILNKLDATYPEYGFKKHKGYGTKEHLQAIEQFGPCQEHRKTFAPIKNFKETEIQLSLF